MLYDVMLNNTLLILITLFDDNYIPVIYTKLNEVMINLI